MQNNEIFDFFKNLIKEGSTYSGTTLITCGLIVLFVNAFANYAAYFLLAFGAYKILFSRR